MSRPTKPRILFVACQFFEPENANGVNKILYNLFKNDRELNLGLVCLGQTPSTVAPEFIKHKLYFSGEEARERTPIEKFFRFLSARPQTLLSRNLTIKLADKIHSVHRSFDQIVVVGPNLMNLVDYLDPIVEKKTSLLAIDSLSLYFQSRAESEPSFIHHKIYQIEGDKSLRFEQKYYPQYQKILFVSSKDAAHVSEHIKNHPPIVCIPNGVDRETFYSEGHERRNRHQLIFTGNLDYAPNRQACEFLIGELMPRLNQKNSRYSLKIVGANAPASLKEQLPENTEFLGYVEDLASLLRTSGVYIAPIFHGAGIKNKVLEAMAVDLPVVGTQFAFDGMEFLDRSNCRVVKEPYEVDQWINHLDEISKALLPETIFEYFWPVVLDRYYQAFDETSENSKASVS